MTVKIEAEIYEQQGQWRLRIRAPQWLFQQIEYQLGCNPVLKNIALVLKESTLTDGSMYSDPMTIEQNEFEITTISKLTGIE